MTEAFERHYDRHQVARRGLYVYNRILTSLDTRGLQAIGQVHHGRRHGASLVDVSVESESVLGQVTFLVRSETHRVIHDSGNCFSGGSINHHGDRCWPQYESPTLTTNRAFAR